MLRNRTTEILTNRYDDFITPKIEFETFGDSENESIFTKKPTSRRRSKNPKCRKGKITLLSRGQLYIFCFGYIKKYILTDSISSNDNDTNQNKDHTDSDNISININIPKDIISILLSHICNWDTIVFKFQTDINKNNGHKNGLILVKNIPLEKDIQLQHNNYILKDESGSKNANTNLVYTFTVKLLTKQCDVRFRDGSYDIDCGIIGISKVGRNIKDQSENYRVKFENEFKNHASYKMINALKFRELYDTDCVKHYLNFRKKCRLTKNTTHSTTCAELMSSMTNKFDKYGGLNNATSLFRHQSHNDINELKYEWMITEDVQVCIEKEILTNEWYVYFRKDGKIFCSRGVYDDKYGKLNFNKYDYYFCLSCCNCSCYNKKGFQFQIHCAKSIV